MSSETLSSKPGPSTEHEGKPSRSRRAVILDAVGEGRLGDLILPAAYTPTERRRVAGEYRESLKLTGTLPTALSVMTSSRQDK